MRKTIKAVLFSVLIFPGAGHFSLQRYQRGLIFFVPAMLCVWLLVSKVMDRAYTIVDQIEHGQVPLDPAAISSLVSAAPADADLFMLNAAIWIFVACWIISTIDSFRLGKLADRVESKS